MNSVTHIVCTRFWCPPKNMRKSFFFFSSFFCIRASVSTGSACTARQAAEVCVPYATELTTVFQSKWKTSAGAKSSTLHNYCVYFCYASGGESTIASSLTHSAPFFITCLPLALAVLQMFSQTHTCTMHTCFATHAHTRSDTCMQMWNDMNVDVDLGIAQYRNAFRFFNYTHRVGGCERNCGISQWAKNVPKRFQIICNSFVFISLTLLDAHPTSVCIVRWSEVTPIVRKSN